MTISNTGHRGTKTSTWNCALGYWWGGLQYQQKRPNFHQEIKKLYHYYYYWKKKNCCYYLQNIVLKDQIHRFFFYKNLKMYFFSVTLKYLISSLYFLMGKGEGGIHNKNCENQNLLCICPLSVCTKCMSSINHFIH